MNKASRQALGSPLANRKSEVVNKVDTGMNSTKQCTKIGKGDERRETGEKLLFRYVLRENSVAGGQDKDKDIHVHVYIH